MQEILFKAKRIENGEWVEGYYCKYGYTGKEKHYIIPDYASDLYAFKIDIDTLCQYTGLLDKNGNKIWENDVVKHYNKPFDSEWYIVGIVRWNKQFSRFEKYVVKTDEVHILDSYCVYEAIGNIFDNPELLEE